MKFKVGDRVAVYGPNGDGIKQLMNGCKGSISRVHESKWVRVVVDDLLTAYVHEKQCRRLKPRKKPEVVEFECVWSANYPAVVEGPYNPAFEIIKGKRTRVRVEVL